ncbi:cation diffusion facilitator family transporter [Desulfococcaceae bacterium HSG8]|nr:cation diffusion facilitator family transporter [Desulfococcaceae bacterium HSG8]
MPEQKNSIRDADVRSRLKAIILSLVVSIILMAAKFYAYRITDSSAVLSDALESIINVVASGFALGSIIFAAMPPDESHPYGHGKIEYFSAGFEGAIIMLAALGIFKIGWSHILHPPEITEIESGFLILLGVAVVNLLLGILLIRVGKKTRSLTLIADGKHVMTDVWVTAGVLGGLFLVRLTGWYWLDGTVACLVGLNILVTGAILIRQSFEGLMNASEPGLLDEISELLSKHRREIWIDIHQLRAWRSGNLIHIDFHLILPSDFTLEQAHREGKDVENLIDTHFQGYTSVLIHLDPCTDPDCPVCSRHRCELRRAEQGKQVPWKRETLCRLSDEADN